RREACGRLGEGVPGCKIYERRTACAAPGQSESAGGELCRGKESVEGGPRDDLVLIRLAVPGRTIEFWVFLRCKENQHDHNKDDSRHFDRRSNESAEGTAGIRAIALDGLHP